jgi:hypothetical protein
MLWLGEGGPQCLLWRMGRGRAIVERTEKPYLWGLNGERSAFLDRGTAPRSGMCGGLSSGAPWGARGETTRPISISSATSS